MPLYIKKEKTHVKTFFQENNLNLELYDEWTWAVRECCPEVGEVNEYPFRGSPDDRFNFTSMLENEDIDYEYLYDGEPRMNIFDKISQKNYAKGGVVKPKNLAFSDKHYHILADAIDKVINHYGKTEVKDFVEKNGIYGRYQIQKQATNRLWMDDDNANLRGDRFGIVKNDNWRNETRQYNDKQFDSAVKSILRQKLGIKNYAKGGQLFDDLDIKKGAFTKKAKARGLSTEVFMKKVLANPNRYDEKTRKQAQLMKNMQ